MNVVGIDPGVKGGLVVIGDHHTASRPMPLKKNGKDMDGAAIAGWLFTEEPDLVVVEKLGARNMFAPGGKAVRKAGNEFRFATGYGVIRGVLESMGLKYRLVQPVMWKAAVLAGTDMDKQAAIDYVQQHYPDIDLIPGRCRTPQDGIADAACMAVWGRQQLGLS